MVLPALGSRTMADAGTPWAWSTRAMMSAWMCCPCCSPPVTMSLGATPRSYSRTPSVGEEQDGTGVSIAVDAGAENDDGAEAGGRCVPVGAKARAAMAQRSEAAMSATAIGSMRVRRRMGRR